MKLGKKTEITIQKIKHDFGYHIYGFARNTNLQLYIIFIQTPKTKPQCVKSTFKNTPSGEYLPTQLSLPTPSVYNTLTVAGRPSSRLITSNQTLTVAPPTAVKSQIIH